MAAAEAAASEAAAAADAPLSLEVAPEDTEPTAAGPQPICPAAAAVLALPLMMEETAREESGIFLLFKRLECKSTREVFPLNAFSAAVKVLIFSPVALAGFSCVWLRQGERDEPG